MPISSSGQRRANKSRRVRAVSRSPTGQRGVALILVLLLAVTASAFVILQALNNRSSRETAQRLITVEALAQARRALLGYAVGYADGTHDLDKGPGRLPCPDRAGGSAQGVAEAVGADCRASNDEETGLLPFRTLGLTALTDGSGAPLWYAVSDNFRSLASGAINSDTPGTFTVDDTADVVAVIIAPGPPLPGQLRDSGSTYTAAAWLEGENASLGDNRYTRVNDANHNDTVMIITRAQLMVEVEKVVNKEVDRALASYRHDPDGDDDAAGIDPDCAAANPSCDDGLPWLAPRTASTFASVVGEGTTALAHLPLVELGKSFNANFTAVWSISGSGTITTGGGEPPVEICLRFNVCIQDFADSPPVGPPTPTPVSFSSPVLGTPSASWSQGSCIVDRDTKTPYALSLNCTNSVSFTVPGRNLRRLYRIELGGNTRLVAPTATARRLVEVRAIGTWPAGTPGRITIADFDGAKVIGFGKLEFTTLSGTNFIALLKVPFDLEVWSLAAPLDRHLSPGALPRWLSADQWQDKLLLRYAPSEAPGYSGASCQAAGTCLTLRMRHPGDAAATNVHGVRGVVIAAGPPLPATVLPAAPAQTRPSTDLRDYLEGINNTNATDVYERRDSSSSFNDQILPLSP